MYAQTATLLTGTAVDLRHNISDFQAVFTSGEDVSFHKRTKNKKVQKPSQKRKDRSTPRKAKRSQSPSPA